MRTIALLILNVAACRAERAFGTWKMNPARSTFLGDPHPKSFAVRIEPHAKGEVYTVDKVGGDGRASTLSMILYFDGKPRDFQSPGCSGTQSSRRVENRTVEIRRNCDSGETLLVRRSLTQPNELTLDITIKRPDGRRFERCLVLEKQ